MDADGPLLRPLGRTGLRVTPLGLGLAAIGRPGYINLGRDADLGQDRSVAAMRRGAHELLDAAWKAGVRYFDAARSYGRAEEFLASWITARGIAADQLTVGSKWGYTYVGDWRVDAPVHEVKDHSLGALRRQLAESRALLGDRLRLYQVHSATFESGVLEATEVLAELARLRASGLTVGLTVSGPRQADVLRAALEVEVDGVPVFECVQATWNPLDSSVGPALREAHEAGWGVIVKEALANGRLSPRGDPRALTVLEPIARRLGVAVDAVALGAALAQPWADVLLSGAVTRAQLRSNLAALEVKLERSELEEVLSLAEPAEAYWAARSELRWS
ncbi:MAG TPA: aldo/keto reductase [Candidatus Limnocylindrales bacterium]|nr:aldo/keto reductase [Candidatus Limnocylindrales bacterium]